MRWFNRIILPFVLVHLHCTLAFLYSAMQNLALQQAEVLSQLNGTTELLQMGPENEGYQELVENALFEVKDRMSIMETAEIEHGKRIMPLAMPDNHKTFNEEQQKLCKGDYRRKVDDAILKALKFYEAHMENLNIPDHSIALSFIQGMDTKRGGFLQQQYPIVDWIKQICDGLPQSRMSLCFEFARNTLRNRAATNEWKSKTVLQSGSSQFQNIGHEKETAWSLLNANCLEALMVRCEVPYVCELTMFDSNAKSAYQLTHQLLHRIIAENMDCLPNKEKLISPAVNKHLCEKMFKEAELIFELDKIVQIPHLRDLFAEDVAFCGMIGFPNFFRADFLDAILSWQSTSEYGCFVQTGPSKLFTNDPPVTRKLTKFEKASGMVDSGELCKRHFTAVAVQALSMYAEFMNDNCAK